MRVDRWEWTDDDHSIRENRYQVCLRIGDKRSEPPLFPYSRRDTKPLHPKQIMHGFLSPPPFVECVSVSGVDEITIRDEWAECISKVPNLFDGYGGGYKKTPHVDPARNKTGTTDGWKTCEHSWHFNWPDYPGHRGQEW